VSYIETERLFLRTWMPQDEPALAAIYADPETMRYIGSGAPRSREETHASFRQMIEADERDGCSMWPVLLKESSSLIGTCGLMRTEEAGVLELGFAFAPQARGKGYALESARAVLDFALAQMHARGVIALVHPFNARSIALLNKLGLRFERVVRVKRSGVGHELLRYELAAKSA
jgi:RimJ/RimL family protein N-acetyltransferase